MLQFFAFRPLHNTAPSLHPPPATFRLDSPRGNIPRNLSAQKKNEPHLMACFVLFGDPTGNGCYAPCLLDDRTQASSTRLAPTSLKTIINRFLNARCPLRVRFPETKNEAHHTVYFVFFGDPTGNRTPVFAVRGRRPRPLDYGAFLLLDYYNMKNTSCQHFFCLFRKISLIFLHYFPESDKILTWKRRCFI